MSIESPTANQQTALAQKTAALSSPIMPTLAEFRLWQLISPALPVGAYAYSQGMEFAVHQGEVCDVESARLWIEGLLRHSYCHLDIAFFRRLYQCISSSDPIGFMHWNASLLAYRESRELLAEDLQMGRALMRLLLDLDCAIPFGSEEISFAAAFAQAAVNFDIPAQTAAAGMCYSWCENQVACAIKLIPLGQTDGQRLLMQLTQSIAPVVAQAWQLPDRELGYSSQGLASISAFHEQQYSRLFRS